MMAFVTDTDLAATGVGQGAHMVGFINRGSGAIDRTAMAKLRDTVSVVDFGAIPDSGADSSAAFKAAIETKKTVLVPAGTYRLNITITKSNVEIIGDNYEKTILIPHTATNPVITINGDISARTIEKFSIRNLSIRGSARAGHGISIVNTSDERGCDFLNFEDLFILDCHYGIHVAGRSIWNSFRNVRCAFNIDGWHIETDQACNAWLISNCQSQQNDRHGLYARNTGGNEILVFTNWKFDQFNSEGNGRNGDVADCYGVYLENVQCFDFSNCYIENNGQGILSTSSYGIKVSGEYGRFVNISNCWVVGSRYPIFYDGSRKSGRVRDILALPSNGATVGVTIKSNSDPSQPKVEVDALSIQGSTVLYDDDVNGNYGARAIDWVSTPGTSLDFSYVDALTINSAGGAVSINTITGLQPGRVITIANSGTNSITLDAALTVRGIAIVIAGGTAKSLLVQGYPNPGKLFERL